jgi:hypothetical protein
MEHASHPLTHEIVLMYLVHTFFVPMSEYDDTTHNKNHVQGVGSLHILWMGMWVHHHPITATLFSSYL